MSSGNNSSIDNRQRAAMLKRGETIKLEHNHDHHHGGHSHGGHSHGGHGHSHEETPVEIEGEPITFKRIDKYWDPKHKDLFKLKDCANSLNLQFLPEWEDLAYLIKRGKTKTVKDEVRMN